MPASDSTLVAVLAGPLGQQLRVVATRPRGGAANELQDRDRHAGAAARRVDREVRGRPQPLDARAVLAPLRQALLPASRPRLRGKRVGVLPAAARLVLVDPGPELRRRRGRETSAADCRDRPSGSMAMTARRRWRPLRSATGTGPSCRCRSSRRRPRVSRDRASRRAPARRRAPGRHVVATPEVEEAQLFEVLHRRMVTGGTETEDFHHGYGDNGGWLVHRAWRAWSVGGTSITNSSAWDRARDRGASHTPTALRAVQPATSVSPVTLW